MEHKEIEGSGSRRRCKVFLVEGIMRENTDVRTGVREQGELGSVGEETTWSSPKYPFPLRLCYYIVFQYHPMLRFFNQILCQKSVHLHL